MRRAPELGPCAMQGTRAPKLSMSEPKARGSRHLIGQRRYMKDRDEAETTPARVALLLLFP